MTDDEHLQALMVGYQSGSAAAFDELYECLAPALKGYLLTFCRDHDVAHELLQETFLQIHRSRRTYRADAPLKPWAFAIARHVALMHRRAAGARPVLDAAEHPDLADARVAGLEDVLAARQRVARAMAGLPREGRRVMFLRHVIGFSFEEIAARLGIRTGAAKVRASRSRAALRALLGEKE